MSVREAVEKPPSSPSVKTLMDLTSARVRNCAMGRSAKVSVIAWNLIAVVCVGGVSGMEWEGVVDLGEGEGGGYRARCCA